MLREPEHLEDFRPPDTSLLKLIISLPALMCLKHLQTFLTYNHDEHVVN